jgi:serine/threonine protein kinase
MGEASFGKYRLIAELGHGGMADVFLAVMAGPAGSGFSKLTVVKRLRANLADEPEFVEMLVDEARISARLNHPNVVQTNEVGSVDNQYFISMEYLDGQPLHRIQHRAMQKAQKAIAEPLTVPPPSAGSGAPSSVILATDPFPRECQYLILVDTLAGLHHAHSLADYDGSPLDIVHRDVTPHNVFVTYEGQTKVVDFGIAKAAGRASETRQGVVKGKVRYMAPEQAIGQRVDCRADVFSVGIMLWEAAAGRRLWKDMDDLNIVQALVGGTMQSSPREINPSVPEAVDKICRKALAFNVDDRYASAEEFRVDLEQYLAESGQLVSARRKLGAVVSDLFKDKRAEIKAVIEKQLAQLKARNTGDLKPVPIPQESTSSRSLPASSAGAVSLPADAADGGDSHTSMTDAATELYTGTKKTKGTKRLAASRLPLLFAAGALVVATAVFASTRNRSTHEDPRPAVPASAETTSADIRIKISTNPVAAHVSIDGAPLATPGDARMPRDGREHLVRVEAPGFEPHVETIRFESDLAMSVVLTKGAPVASVRPSTPAAPPTQKWWPVAPATPAKPPPPVPVVATNPPPVASTAPSGKAKPPPLFDPKEDPWKHSDAGH